MKNELRGVLELTENAIQKYTFIFNEEQWLDNQEVCLMMNITKRTLQTYKDKGLLPYSRLTDSICKDFAASRMEILCGQKILRMDYLNCLH